MLDVEFAELSDMGRKRQNNEDFLGSAPPATPAHAQTHGWLFALADGVGGQAQGEVASRVAIESLLDGFRGTAAGEPPGTLLPRLVQAANARVFDTALRSGPLGASMATTVVACLFRFDRVAVSHVGDSRCYLIRRGHAVAITRDHTVANEQLRLGVISAGEAATAETTHILSRSLGMEMFVRVETTEHQVHPGDIVLLCSDGLHGALGTAEIGHIVSHHEDLHSAAQELVTVANERDGSDNVSVLLVRVQSVERVGMYRGRPYKLH